MSHASADERRDTRRVFSSAKERQMFRADEAASALQPGVAGADVGIPAPVRRNEQGYSVYIEAVQQALAYQARSVPHVYAAERQPFDTTEIQRAFAYVSGTREQVGGILDHFVRNNLFISPKRLLGAMNKLGDGNFGVVRVNRLVPLRGGRAELVAVKQLRPMYWAATEEEYAIEAGKIAQEALVMVKCASRHVMPLLGVSQIGREVAIVMPIARRGTLLGFLSKEMNRIRYADPAANVCYPDVCMFTGLLYQVVVGVQEMHERGIGHGDLQAGNVLVTSDNTAVISDFGCAAWDDALFCKDSLALYEMCNTVGGGLWGGVQDFNNAKRSEPESAHGLKLIIQSLIDIRPRYGTVRLLADYIADLLMEHAGFDVRALDNGPIDWTSDPS